MEPYGIEVFLSIPVDFDGSNGLSWISGRDSGQFQWISLDFDGSLEWAVGQSDGFRSCSQ